VPDLASAAVPGPATRRSSYARRVWSQRSVVDYGLARRATLNKVLAAPVGPTAAVLEACEAHPYLLRAARFVGTPTGRDCPVCHRERVVDVSYVYGEQLGRAQGRVKTRAELAAMAHEHGEFRVYVVEVCQECSWNHLTLSYVLGDGVRRQAPRRRRTAEDDYP
jgi:hypothetical protein